MELASYVVAAVIAYLLGSIPTGYLAGRLRGVDIRQSGSGNIGATNVMRVLGKPAGIIVLIIDGLKGYAACAWVAEEVSDFRPKKRRFHSRISASRCCTCAAKTAAR